MLVMSIDGDDEYFQVLRLLISSAIAPRGEKLEEREDIFLSGLGIIR